MSTLFVRTLREDPADAEVPSHKLLVRGSYIRRVAPGIYTWLPLGLKVLRKVETVIREEMDAAGAQEVLFPALLPREPYEATGRWEEYGPQLFRLQDRRENDFLLAPTHEEMFTLLVKDLYSSYKDLPLTLYQIQTKYRDEARPRAGLIRTREFLMKDAYSFDMEDAGLEDSYAAMRAAYQKIFQRLGLPYQIVTAVAGAMGGSKSEEFLYPTPVGEDTFVRSAGGYVANVEAVKTVQPPAQDFANEPEAELVSTPDAKTIEDLVEVANRVHPREDRPWQAADTLKTVLLKLTHPSGETELVMVAVPGDREVDFKRVEASLAPAEIEMADAEAIAAYPELVPGYMGPGVFGPQSARRTGSTAATTNSAVSANGEAAGKAAGKTAGDGATAEAEAGEAVPPLRLLLDPHIARGSSWIAGGNENEKHFFHYVYGRDFEADGFIEAAEVREGDPAPDGSGPMELARGIEIGHIFQLGRKYSEALGLTVLDENGKSRVVTMGSYGIGVSRVMASLAEEHHDERGIVWPVAVAPAQVHVLATGKDAAVFETAEKIAAELEQAGVEVLFDDRRRVSAGVKFKDYELLGMPYGIVVGRALADGNVELRNRRTDERELVPVDQAVATMRKLLAAHNE
ncbi:prolyl-tRNA synthetase [Actinobaculum suis]|uniref:Proline--tRNA ligase n=1 Tax=Actinobaculum suis TaxID=1657 RepID=A0A1G6ZHC0_9ACTO|nr:proline--tRNA ligase [Actinobaculum suis]MDY5154043.1 proline--tRNA ligase [Actinobaculum suis]SDE01861.1 prolyl-tRNA synthetase [Actinobaculum suis]